MVGDAALARLGNHRFSGMLLNSSAEPVYGDGTIAGGLRGHAARQTPP
jgi:hypothetical protein